MHRKKRGNLQPPASSIVLHLEPIFIARNILHPFTYLKKIGISGTTATKMLRGDAVQLNFRQLTTLCLNLNCSPNDLLALRQMELPQQHGLHVLHQLVPQTETTSINDWLATKTAEEVQEILRQIMTIESNTP